MGKCWQLQIFPELGVVWLNVRILFSRFHNIQKWLFAVYVLEINFRDTRVFLSSKSATFSMLIILTSLFRNFERFSKVSIAIAIEHLLVIPH